MYCSFPSVTMSPSSLFYKNHQTSMSGKTLGILAVIIIIIVGVWMAISSSSSAPTTTTNPPPPTTATETPPPPAPTGTTAAKTVITMTDSGFSPKNVTVAEGTTVTWVNNSSVPMWVASDVHPTHTDYDGTSKNAHCAAGYTGPTPLDECAGVPKGGTFTFTFTKAGTWPIHNHAAAQMTGTITVTTASASGNVNVTL